MFGSEATRQYAEDLEKKATKMTNSVSVCFQMETKKKTDSSNRVFYVPVVREVPFETIHSGAFVLDANRGIQERYGHRKQYVWLIRNHIDWVDGFLQSTQSRKRGRNEKK